MVMNVNACVLLSLETTVAVTNTAHKTTTLYPVIRSTNKGIH